MNKNYLVWGIIVLVVVLVGYYMMKGYSSPSQNTQNEPTITESANPTVVATTSAEVMAKVTVDYTDDGFIPKTITVKVGDKITWNNKSSKSMWVASAPHPTHTALPGFDELSAVEKGGTYSFTFTKAGSWKYHNHLSPKDGGMVVVQ